MGCFGGDSIEIKLLSETRTVARTIRKKADEMLMLATLPASDLLKAALVRRPLSVRILILITCLAICRRGRAAMSYTAYKVCSVFIRRLILGSIYWMKF